MAASLATRAGEVHAMQVDAIVLKGGTVVGSLPIVGNGMTINGTLTIASATVSRGGSSNASTTIANPTEVGTTNFSLFSFKIQAGSAEDVRFNTVRVYQIGSASFDDLDNVALFKDATKLVDGVVDPNDSKYMNFSIPAGIQINKGQTGQFLVRGDVISGSSRTIQLAINNSTDLIVQGLASGYNAVPSYSGAGSSANKPSLTDNQFTIGAGTVVVSKSNDIPSGNITIADNQEVGAFKFRVEGEPVEVTAFTLVVASTDATNITLADATHGYKIVDENGVTVAGPTDLTVHTLQVRFSDTFTVPVGEHVYTIVASVAANSGFASNDTLTVSVTPSTGTTLRGDTTGDTITATPSSSISANAQTFKVGTVAVTRNGVPSDATYILGDDQALFGSWTFDATDSGEDVRVTSIGIAASATNVNNLTLYFDGVSQTPINSDPASAGTRTTSSYTLGDPLVIPKNTKVKVELKGDISSAGASGEVSQFGITSNAAVTVTGVNTGNTLTATVTADDGAVITYAGAGTLTIANFNTPEQALILSGTTGYTVNSIKLTGTREDIVLDDLTVRIADGGLTGTGTGNYKDVANVAIYNGATKLIESNIPSTGSFKFNFSQNPASTNYVKIPADGSVTLTVKVDTAQITTQGTDNPGTPNADFAIGFGGVNSVKATGQASGDTATETYQSSTSTAKILHSSAPRITVASTSNRLGAASTLSNGDIRLFAFDVTADSAQNRPVMIYRVSFAVTTSGNTVAGLYLKQEGVGSKISSADAEAAGRQDTTSTGPWRVSFVFNSPDFSHGDAEEQLEISAGTTKRYYLHGTVASASAGDAVTVSLLGDTASAMTSQLTGAIATNFDQVGAATNQGNAFSDGGKFVWSDDHTNLSGSQTATASGIWFNGNLVDGLEKTVTTTGYTISL